MSRTGGILAIKMQKRRIITVLIFLLLLFSQSIFFLELFATSLMLPAYPRFLMQNDTYFTHFHSLGCR